MVPMLDDGTGPLEWSCGKAHPRREHAMGKWTFLQQPPPLR